MNQHIGNAMLQRLKSADRHTELLARLDISHGGIDEGLHDADSLGAQRRQPEIERRFDHRQRAAFGAESITGGHFEAF